MERGFATGDDGERERDLQANDSTGNVEDVQPAISDIPAEPDALEGRNGYDMLDVDGVASLGAPGMAPNASNKRMPRKPRPLYLGRSAVGHYLTGPGPRNLGHFARSAAG